MFLQVYCRLKKQQTGDAGDLSFSDLFTEPWVRRSVQSTCPTAKNECLDKPLDYVNKLLQITASSLDDDQIRTKAKSLFDGCVPDRVQYYLKLKQLKSNSLQTCYDDIFENERNVLTSTLGDALGDIYNCPFLALRLLRDFSFDTGKSE